MNFTQLDDHKLIVPFHYSQLASALLLYSSIAEFDNVTSANLDLRAQGGVRVTTDGTYQQLLP